MIFCPIITNAQSWTALFRAFSSHQRPSAYLSKGIPQLLDKSLGQIGQTLMACTMAKAFLGIDKRFFNSGTLQSK